MGRISKAFASTRPLTVGFGLGSDAYGRSAETRLEHSVSLVERLRAMNRIPLSKSRPTRRPRPENAPARLELTLELPRGRDGSQTKPAEKAEEGPRGVALVDFYIS